MKVINGNNIDILKQYPDNYFDAIVTDPPYGLGKEPNAEELMKDWIEKGYHEITGSGFMGKEWDAFVPQPVFWKEVFRVLKHGGHILAFFGTRTYDWGVMSMRFAGFEVRDCIQWLYGSGFPKSHNISKAIDKMYGAEREIVGQREDILNKQSKDLELGKRKYVESLNNGSPERNNGFVNVSADITIPATDQAKQWDGWGSALKPANEPIVLARKPLEKGLSIAENVLKWGTGAINIDGCRVGFKNESDFKSATFGIQTDIRGGNFNNNRPSDGNILNKNVEANSQGRFPANLILTHHPDCECVGTKKVGKGERKQHEDGEISSANEGYTRPNKSSFTHKDSSVIANYGEEEVEDWVCHEDCPIKILDEQSGESTYADKGGASRFFYVAKASKSERNKGLDGFEEKIIEGRDEGQDERNVAYKPRPTPMANIHPTVKPIKLMQYLVRLITPPNGIVLDPFCGSGTTGIACKLEGMQFVGLEQDAEYCKIAQARINNYSEEKENKKSKKTTEEKNDQLSLF